jgi:phosphatidylglycerophosphate synthase
MDLVKMQKNNLPTNYFVRVKEIGAKQNCKEFYSHYFTRHMSKFFSAALSYTAVTANHITLSMFVFGFFGAFLFSLGSEIYYILGSISFMLLNVADAADGELARYTKTTSMGGDYLDRIAHYATNAVAILGMGVGLFLQFGELWILVFAIVVEVAHTIDDSARDLLVTCGLTNENQPRKDEKQKTQALKSKRFLRFGQIIGSNMAFFHLVAVFALVDLYFPMLAGISLTLGYFLTFGLISIVKLCLRIYKIKSLYFV